MKTIILIVVALFLSFPANSAWFGLVDDEPEVKEPEKPALCYYSFDIGKGVFFVFEGGCDGITHRGIIDVRKNKVLVLNDSLEKDYDSNFTTPKARIEFTNKKWKDITPVKYSTISD